MLPEHILKYKQDAYESLIALFGPLALPEVCMVSIHPFFCDTVLSIFLHEVKVDQTLKGDEALF